MALKGRLTSVMLKWTLSVQKFSGILNVTRREIQPCGINDTRPTLENGCDGWSFDIKICSFLIRLRATPLLMRTWYSLMLLGETISGS
jgi:hypothetical protein